MHPRPGRRALLSLLACLALSLTNLNAQVTTGAVSGTVVDPSNAAVPGVKVTVTDTETGASRTVTTGEAGEYVVNLLPLGKYKIAAEKQGFTRVVLPDIQLVLNQTVRIDISLHVGSVSETVEVNSAPPLVDTTQSAIGTVETEQRIVELPLNGRNFVALADLGSGVNSGVTGATNNGTTFETARANQSLSVNGLSVLNNNFLLDGLDNNEFGNGAAVALPPPDAIAEFRTEESLMGAEFGRGGAAVNVVLKSGSNQIHGDAWEFLRNDKLDARNYFDPTRTPFKRNQFGFSLGGPIRKNRTFFFGDYQGTRVRESQPYYFHGADAGGTARRFHRTGDRALRSGVYRSGDRQPKPAQSGEPLCYPGGSNQPCGPERSESLSASKSARCDQ